MTESHPESTPASASPDTSQMSLFQMRIDNKLDGLDNRMREIEKGSIALGGKIETSAATLRGEIKDARIDMGKATLKVILWLGSITGIVGAGIIGALFFGIFRLSGSN